MKRLRGFTKRQRTKQLDFEPDLCQRLDKVRGLLRRDVPAIPPKHVQPVRPIRPTRDVRGDRVRKRALGRDQREGKGRRHKFLRPGAPTHHAAAVRRQRRGAIRCGDFGDQRDVKAVGEVLEPVADRELGVAVNVVKMFQAVVLPVAQRKRVRRFCQDGDAHL